MEQSRAAEQNLGLTEQEKALHGWSCQPRWRISWAWAGEVQLQSSWWEFIQHVQEGDPSQSCSVCEATPGTLTNFQLFAVHNTDVLNQVQHRATGWLAAGTPKVVKSEIWNPQRCSKCDWMRFWQPVLMDLLPIEGWITQLPKNPSSLSESCDSDTPVMCLIYYFQEHFICYVLDLIN